MSNESTTPALRVKGDPVLAKVADRIEDISEETIQEFAMEMAETCYENNGAGLAAPQMGVSKRMFVMLVMGEPEVSGEALDSSYEIVMNPKILKSSDEKEKDWEGCLSIPGSRGLVPRAYSIEVEYQTLDGDTVNAKIEGYPARVFQHEYDHLDGILYPDRMDKEDKLISEKEYEEALGASILQEQGTEEEPESIPTDT